MERTTDDPSARGVSTRSPQADDSRGRETEAQTSPSFNANYFDNLSASSEMIWSETTLQASYLQTSIEAELSGLSPSGSTRTEAIDNFPSTMNLDPVIHQLRDPRSIMEKPENLMHTLAARRHNERQAIFRLPNEIILEMIELGVPVPGDSWSSEASPWPVNKYPAWKWTAEEYDAFRTAVGSTCSVLRTLVLSSQKAWGSLYISYPHIPPLILKMRLQRSSRVPLHLFIKWSRINNRAVSLSEYKPVIRPHQSRCHSIVIKNRINKQSLFPSLFDAENLSDLRHLYLTFGGENHKNDSGTTTMSLPWMLSSLTRPSSFANIAPRLLLNNLPTLHSLSLRDNFSASDSTLPALQSYELFSPNLTRLRLSGPFRTVSVIKFLSQCSGLEHFEWRSSVAYANPSVSPSILQMPNLKSLCLVGNNSALNFPPSNAPKLEQIVIGVFDSRDNTEAHLIRSCIFHPLQPQLPSIKRVKFDPSTFHAKSIEEFFVRHPSIEEVVLDHFEITEVNRDVVPLTDMLTILRTVAPRRKQRQTQPQAHQLRRLMLNLKNLDDSASIFRHVIKDLEKLHKALPKLEIFAYRNASRRRKVLPFIKLVSDHEPEIDDAWASPWSYCEWTSDEE
ncbi:hypothetical protein DL93DRAFT_2225091 [Clavulina sp. PMI_390]|nr:hypothetical protein DL93DRAFT_2225091 [Clavulina sp. PMI_390]